MDNTAVLYALGEKYSVGNPETLFLMRVLHTVAGFLERKIPVKHLRRMSTPVPVKEYQEM